MDWKYVQMHTLESKLGKEFKQQHKNIYAIQYMEEGNLPAKGSPL